MDKQHIIETIKMLDENNLDIRTVTLAINLMDCIDSDYETACAKIYNKMIYCAKALVSTADRIGEMYGVPIINKRLSVTPIALIAGATDLDDYTSFAQTLDKVAKETGVDFVGGFSALTQSGTSPADLALINSIPHALSTTERVCASVNVGDTKSGLSMDDLKRLGEVHR